MNELRTQKEMEFLTNIDALLTKNFLNDLSGYQIVPKVEYDLEEEIDLRNVRFVKVEKIVLDQEQSCREKLLNLYNAVSDCKGSMIMTICSDGESVELSLGVKCEDSNYLPSCKEVLEGVLEGAFQGSTVKAIRRSPLETYEEDIQKVAVVSGIPGVCEQKEEGFIGQMETIIETMRGRKYCLVTIADYVEQETLYRIKNEYEEVYTQISFLGELTYNYQESETKSRAETLTESITDTLSKSLSETANRSFSSGQSNGMVSGKNYNASLLLFGGGRQQSDSRTFSYTDSISNGVTKGESISRGSTNAHGETRSISDSHSNSVQVKLDNKRIKDLLVKLDRQIERIDDALNSGLWETAVYCMAPDDFTCQMATSMMKSVFSGTKNSIEGFRSYIWSEKRQSELVKKYVLEFKHPLLKGGDCVLKPTSIINGEELVTLAQIPQKSVSGLEICSKVPFSRNIMYINSGGRSKMQGMELGNVYHMGKAEKGRVSLDYDTLTGHTFVSGTTGTGKTNVVIGMLQDLEKQKIPYLVIEPVKGEYANYLNADKYDTSGEKGLRINPFSFPKGIHVYEHIDRVLEILKVCWPMEAAMPDILKSAILCAYEECGWNLEESYCSQPVIYPNFMDVLQQLKNVISQSDFSQEVKGNYIGALVNRIKSMTNGMNAKIFNSRELSQQELFEQNVIVDLSKVGASETKSLIMGVIILKLNEYYLGQDSIRKDRKLSHMTVLEEAHHLLKNPSSVITASGGNQLQQKSIELLSNSICEMRFYGEGFVIADQSPEAVDASAIKNTNTKIILRMPDYDDRIKIGKTCGLEEKQIQEIAKLETGVAVIYQGNWEKAILCKIEHHKSELKPENTEKTAVKNTEQFYRQIVLKFLMRERMNQIMEIKKSELYEAIQGLVLSGKSRRILLRMAEKWGNGITDSLFLYTHFRKLAELVLQILNCEEKLIYYSEYLYDMEELKDILQEEIRYKTGCADTEFIVAIMQCVLRSMFTRKMISEDDYKEFFKEYLEQWERRADERV